MDGAYHYRQAERLLWLAGPDSTYRTSSKDELGALIWMAQVHANLAGAAATIESGSPGTGQRWRDALAARTGAPQNGEVGTSADVPSEPTDTTRTKAKASARHRRKVAAED